MKPTFIGIGAQKCATTWIYRILFDHPQAWLAQPKEVDFFSYYYGFGFQWYEQHFCGGTGRPAVGEISASYLQDLAAPFRANQYNASLRVIVALRDPIERAYSNHLHEIRIGHYRGKDLSFEAGLANNPMYVEQSCYTTHLQRWFSAFPREQLLVLLQEEILTSPVKQARRIYEFLGIDPNHQSSFLHQRPNQSCQPRSGRFEFCTKKAGWFGQKLGLNGMINRIKKNRMVASIRNANTVTMYDTIPSMLPKTRATLERRFAVEILRLAELIEQDSFPWPTWYTATGIKRTAIHSDQAMNRK